MFDPKEPDDMELKAWVGAGSLLLRTARSGCPAAGLFRPAHAVPFVRTGYALTLAMLLHLLKPLGCARRHRVSRRQSTGCRLLKAKWTRRCPMSASSAWLSWARTSRSTWPSTASR